MSCLPSPSPLDLQSSKTPPSSLGHGSSSRNIVSLSQDGLAQTSIVAENQFDPPNQVPSGVQPLNHTQQFLEHFEQARELDQVRGEQHVMLYSETRQPQFALINPQPPGDARVNNESSLEQQNLAMFLMHQQHIEAVWPRIVGVHVRWVS
jgi:hypothetical protein